MGMQVAVMHACETCTGAHPKGRSQGCQRQRAVLMHMPAQPSTATAVCMAAGGYTQNRLAAQQPLPVLLEGTSAVVLATTAQQELTFIMGRSALN